MTVGIAHPVRRERFLIMSIYLPLTQNATIVILEPLDPVREE